MAASGQVRDLQAQADSAAHRWTLVGRRVAITRIDRTRTTANARRWQTMTAVAGRGDDGATVAAPLAHREALTISRRQRTVKSGSPMSISAGIDPVACCNALHCTAFTAFHSLTHTRNIIDGPRADTLDSPNSAFTGSLIPSLRQLVPPLSMAAELKPANPAASVAHIDADDDDLEPSLMNIIKQVDMQMTGLMSTVGGRMDRIDFGSAADERVINGCEHCSLQAHRCSRHRAIATVHCILPSYACVQTSLKWIFVGGKGGVGQWDGCGISDHRSDAHAQRALSSRQLRFRAERYI